MPSSRSRASRACDSIETSSPDICMSRPDDGNTSRSPGYLSAYGIKSGGRLLKLSTYPFSQGLPFSM
jgi:hypothetical protein